MILSRILTAAQAYGLAVSVGMTLVFLFAAQFGQLSEHDPAVIVDTGFGAASVMFLWRANRGLPFRPGITRGQRAPAELTGAIIVLLAISLGWRLRAPFNAGLSTHLDALYKALALFVVTEISRSELPALFDRLYGRTH